MSLPVLLLPKAKEDIRDQLAYLGEYGEDLVGKLIDALEDTFAHLAQFLEPLFLRDVEVGGRSDSFRAGCRQGGIFKEIMFVSQ